MRRALGTGRLWKRPQAGGAVWIGDWKSADGTRQRRMLGPDKGVAQRRLALLIRERDLVASGLGVEEGIDRPAAEVISEFLAELTASRSPRYVRRVRDILVRVQANLRFRTLRDLRPQALLQYRRMRLGQHCANRTCNMEVRVVGTMLNWAVRTGLLAFNPIAGIRSLPAGRAYEKKPRRAMSEDEAERFVAAAIQIDEESFDRAFATRTIESGARGSGYAAKPRLRPIPQVPMWLVLATLGPRFGELTSTTWADLSESRATLTLRAATTKARRERVLPLPPELMETLRSLRVAQHERLGRIPGPAERIFLSPSGAPWTHNHSYVIKRFRAVLELAGIPIVDARGEKLDVHALRYTAATRMARNGVPLVVCQRLLGHSTVALTAQVYTRLEVEDLRAAVESLPALRMARGVRQALRTGRSTLTQAED